MGGLPLGLAHRGHRRHARRRRLLAGGRATVASSTTATPGSSAPWAAGRWSARGGRRRESLSRRGAQTRRSGVQTVRRSKSSGTVTPRQGRQVHLLAQVGEDQVHVGVGGLQGPDGLLVHVRGRDPGRGVPPVALDHQDVGSPASSRQAVRRAWCRPNSRRPGRPGRTGSRSSAGRGRARPRWPGSAAGRPPASSRPPRRSAGPGWRRPVGDRADGTRLVELARCASIPGGPTTWSVRPPPASAARLEQEGPAEAVVGVEVRDDDHLDRPRRRSRSGAGAGRAVGEGSTRTDPSRTKLFQ